MLRLECYSLGKAENEIMVKCARQAVKSARAHTRNQEKIGKGKAGCRMQVFWFEIVIHCEISTGDRCDAALCVLVLVARAVVRLSCFTHLMIGR